jgi:hypothetical protein
MNSVFWWIRQIILTLAGCFFLFFGINLLIAAYRLNNPPWFIMTFFASNFMILISATLIFGFVYRMWSTFKKLREDNETITCWRETDGKEKTTTLRKTPHEAQKREGYDA